MSLLLNNSLIISKSHLVESIDKMNATYEQIKSLHYENEQAALAIAQIVTNEIAKNTSATSETLSSLQFLRSTNPNSLHSKVISEIVNHKNNVEVHNTDDLNAAIKECLLKSSELRVKISQTQNEIASLREKLYPSSLVRWSENALKFTTNELYIDLSTRSFISGLFSSRVNHARKLEKLKKKLIKKAIKTLNTDNGIDFEASPKDIIDKNNEYFGKLTSLLELDKELTNELFQIEEFEGNMLQKLAGIANSKRYLNTYDHEDGVKQRILELVCQHEFSKDEIDSYCRTHGSWNLVDDHNVYEAKKMFLSIKISDLRLHLDNMKKCLALIDSLINGKCEPSLWLKLRSQRIAKAFETHTTIFNDYSESLLEACIDASSCTPDSSEKALDSYACFFDMTQRFICKEIPPGNLPSALFKSLISETTCQIGHDDFKDTFEDNIGSEHPLNTPMVA